MEVEWAPQSSFAEAAEALGITTSEVFSAIPFPDGGMSVIYTPGVTDDNVYEVTTYLGLLARDAEGILRKAREPVVIPDFLARLKDGLGFDIGGDADGNG